MEEIITTFHRTPYIYIYTYGITVYQLQNYSAAISNSLMTQDMLIGHF